MTERRYNDPNGWSCCVFWPAIPCVRMDENAEELENHEKSTFSILCTRGLWRKPFFVIFKCFSSFLTMRTHAFIGWNTQHGAKTNRSKLAVFPNLLTLGDHLLIKFIYFGRIIQFYQDLVWALNRKKNNDKFYPVNISPSCAPWT